MLKKYLKQITKLTPREFYNLSGFVLLFVVIRILYFDNLFKFIFDQATSSTFVLEMFKNREISLIGPPMSLNINDRQIFFGGFSYIMQLFFMLVGNWDPFWSTFAFMIFASLMVFPLYYGAKILINKNVAYLMVLVYSLTPFYIEGTTQLWNPYFQISLVPLLIYLMGLFKKYKTKKIFFALSLMSGLIFQLHYQFVINVLGLLFFYFLIKKLSLKFFLIFSLGFAFGVSNLLIFELRNDFYNTRTVFIFLQNLGKASSHEMAGYYVMSIVFMAILPLSYFLKKFINFKLNLIAFFVFLLFSINYTAITALSRNYPEGWFYRDEIEAYEIIKDLYEKAGLRDFNVFQFYSATGESLKYFMKRDGLEIDFNDYYNNKYLFVVYKDDAFMNDLAYEINTFRPNKELRRWKINEMYSMYLLERI